MCNNNNCGLLWGKLGYLAGCIHSTKDLFCWQTFVLNGKNVFVCVGCDFLECLHFCTFLVGCKHLLFCSAMQRFFLAQIRPRNTTTKASSPIARLEKPKSIPLHEYRSSIFTWISLLLLLHSSSFSLWEDLGFSSLDSNSCTMPREQEKIRKKKIYFPLFSFSHECNFLLASYSRLTLMWAWAG